MKTLIVSMERIAVITALAGTFALGTTATSNAITITAFEKIEDIAATTNPRNLRRTRDNDTSVSGTTVENTDATIIADNLVSPSFGENTADDVTYTHKTDWLTGINTFLSGSLLIVHRDAAGNDDNVFIDITTPLTSLNPSTGQTSTTFTFNHFEINMFLQDDALNVLIDKSVGDFIDIVASTLTVTFDPDAQGGNNNEHGVPEGGSTLTMGGIAALLLLGFHRFHRKRIPA